MRSHTTAGSCAWRARARRRCTRGMCVSRRSPRQSKPLADPPPGEARNETPRRIPWLVGIRMSAASREPAESRDQRARDLLVTTHTPALRSGRDMRTYGIARALALNGGLTLLYVRFGPAEPDDAFRAIEGMELREVIPSRGITRGLAYVKALHAGVPSGLARGISPELSRTAVLLAAASGGGRVIADGPTAAAALARLAELRPVIYNAHNLESGFRHELR